MSTVNSTDLMLINRANVAYKVSVADLKKAVGGGVFAGPTPPPNPTHGMLWVDTGSSPPNLMIYDATSGKWMVGQSSPPSAPSLNTVTLTEDAPGGDRFTSQVFTVQATYNNNGPPSASGSLKAWVEGTFKQGVVTDTITKVDTSAVMPPTSTTIFRNGNYATPAQTWGYGSDIYTATGPPTSYTQWWTAPQFYMDEQSMLLFDPPISGGAITMSFRSLHVNLGNGNTFHYSSSKTGGWSDYTYDESHMNLQTLAMGNTLARVSTGSAHGNGSKGYIQVFGFWIDGVWWSLYGVTELSFASNKGIAALKPGDTITQSDSAATGNVLLISGDKIIVPRASAGWVANGTNYATGPLADVPGVKKYLVLNASGSVTTMQDADPGWVPITQAGAGNGPFTSKLTFPPQFPSGRAPDADIPAGVQVAVNFQGTNSEGSDNKASAALTPT